MSRLLRAVGSLVVILALVVGLPVALVVMVGNPWPAGGIDASAPLTTEAVMGLVAVVAWVLWLQMVVCLVVEAVAAMRDAPSLHVRLAIGGQQRLARTLVHGVMLLGVGASAVTPAVTSYAQAEPTATVQRTDDLQHRRTDGPHVTVREGDSLWSLADAHLGDGLRWKEIAALNDGRRMPDGTRFSRDVTLQPGWQVRLPSATRMVVRPGDTLSALASEHLGDADRWRDLWHANRDAIDDPDVLPVGLVLRLPGQTAAASTTTVEEPSAREQVSRERPSTPRPPVSSDHRATPVRAVEPVDRPAPLLQRTQDDHQTSGVDIVTPVVGIGAVLGVGLLTTLAVRRRRQGRHRSPGQRTPRPPFDVRRLEARLAHQTETTVVDDVDNAVRRLVADAGRTPTLRAVRAGHDVIEVFLEEPVVLPAPWRETSDDTVWLLPRGAASVATGGPAPYPCLVTVGQDDDGVQVLVDLGGVGVLGLPSPHPGSSREAAAAMAVELATSPWGEGLQVTVVGGLPELPELLDSGRVAYQPTLHSLIGRLRDRDPDQGWPEVVMLIGDHPGDDVRQARAVARTTAPTTSVVTSAAEPWSVRLEGERARLEPLGLDLSPARLDAGPFTDLMEALAITGDPCDGTPSGMAEPRRARDGGYALEPAPPAAVSTVPEAPEGPRVLLLGDVDVVGAPGAAPGSHRRATVAEMAAYIAVHPGCTLDEIQQVMWRQLPDRSTAEARLTDLRRWLGAAPCGDAHLPGGDVLRLVEVTTDAERWDVLIGDGHATASTVALQAALDLVRGRPVAGATSRRYAWARPLQQELADRVLDVAVELARRRYASGELDAAEHVVAVGLGVEPALESLWRLRLQIDHARGDRAAIERHVDELEQATLDLGELAPETARLVDDLLQAA